MIDSGEVLAGAGVGGFGLWLIQSIWTKVLGKEGKANDALIQQLTERIAAQEARLVVLEAGLDDERKARRAAETTVYELRIRIMLLEAELRKHHIEVPDQPVWRDPMAIHAEQS